MDWVWILGKYQPFHQHSKPGAAFFDFIPAKYRRRRYPYKSL
jgi:hypothetical protein